jgi:hypothetical protein
MRTLKNDGHVNARGNSHDRKARKIWMLGHFGDGIEAQCWECGATVTIDTMVADRIIPGKDGGRYVHNNIRPQCPLCSCRQGYEMGMGRLVAA